MCQAKIERFRVGGLSRLWLTVVSAPMLYRVRARLKSRGLTLSCPASGGGLQEKAVYRWKQDRE